MMENKIGCFVSFTKPNYFIGSIDSAINYGANCCMIYLGSPRTPTFANLTQNDINELHNHLNKVNWTLNDIVVHAPYIINLASNNPKLIKNGQQTIIQLVKLCHACQIKTMVLHPGSNPNQTQGLKQLTESINEIIKQTNDCLTTICIETMAGKGNEICWNFQQIHDVIINIKQKERIGVCLDTCHMNDGGINLQKIEETIEKIKSSFGLNYVKLIHLNDSLNVVGSKKDRHANIGCGTIGLETLKKWANHPLWSSICKILETPFGEKDFNYKQEINLLIDK